MWNMHHWPFHVLVDCRFGIQITPSSEECQNLQISQWSVNRLFRQVMNVFVTPSYTKQGVWVSSTKRGKFATRSGAISEKGSSEYKPNGMKMRENVLSPSFGRPVEPILPSPTNGHQRGAVVISEKAFLCKQEKVYYVKLMLPVLRPV